MREIILGSVEYQGWGLNAPTVSACATFILTIAIGWTIWLQARKVWVEKNGESMSTPWFIYFLFFNSVFFLYGMETHSIAKSFNGGVHSLMHIPVVVGLWKYKGFGRAEWTLLAIAPLMIPAMLFIPWKGAVFATLFILALASAATQPLELYRTKKPGTLEPRLVGGFATSSTFWTIFAFSTGDRGMMFSMPVAVAVHTTTLVLWLKYRRQAQSAPVPEPA